MHDSVEQPSASFQHSSQCSSQCNVILTHSGRLQRTLRVKLKEGSMENMLMHGVWEGEQVHLGGFRSVVTLALFSCFASVSHESMLHIMH